MKKQLSVTMSTGRQYIFKIEEDGVQFEDFKITEDNFNFEKIEDLLINKKSIRVNNRIFRTENIIEISIESYEL